ncbi:hypothetical protein L1049_026732 [Liquidambar formosana]|uniref:Uncharacterized protein n=1 Tax=Liquidambar formosana TaxID=63359 RepID=A0AAP0NDX7_LIQFO
MEGELTIAEKVPSGGEKVEQEVDLDPPREGSKSARKVGTMGGPVEQDFDPPTSKVVSEETRKGVGEILVLFVKSTSDETTVGSVFFVEKEGGEGGKGSRSSPDRVLDPGRRRREGPLVCRTDKGLFAGLVRGFPKSQREKGGNPDSIGWQRTLLDVDRFCHHSRALDLVSNHLWISADLHAGANSRGSGEGGAGEVGEGEDHASRSLDLDNPLHVFLARSFYDNQKPHGWSLRGQVTQLDGGERE